MLRRYTYRYRKVSVLFIAFMNHQDTGILLSLVGAPRVLISDSRFQVTARLSS